MLQIKMDNKKFEVKLGEVREHELFEEIVKKLLLEDSPVSPILPMEEEKCSPIPTGKLQNIRKELGVPTPKDRDKVKKILNEFKESKDHTDIPVDYPKTTEHKSKQPPHWDEVDVEKPNRLVFAKCPKCGRQHHVYFNKNRITCLCGTDINFEDKDLKDGEYECPHCKKGTGRFKVLGTLESVSCKECKGGIMLHYDWERDIFTNKQ